MPSVRAFGARRSVCARLGVAGETEPHRHDGDAAFIIERLAVEAEPGTQTCPGRVVVGNAGVVDADARRLAPDAKPGGVADAQHRPRAMGEVARTDAAGANVGEQRREVGFGWHSQRMSTT